MVVDSNEQMLEVRQILQIAAEQSQSEYPVEIVAAAFVKEVEMPGNKFSVRRVPLLPEGYPFAAADYCGIRKRKGKPKECWLTLSS